RQQHNTFPYSF
nr:immunoglobulin light chain junction region [Macaca mulatta]